MSMPTPARVTTTEKPPRPRRRIPLSLRMFVALLGILGLIAAWKGMRIYRQHVAIDKILDLDGNFGNDYDPFDPPWYERRLGIDGDLFANVWAVDLHRGPDIKDVDFGAFPDLKWLELSATRITDGRMADLTGLVRLEDVRFRDTDVTDRGLFCLRRMSRLQQLDLHGTKVTGAGFESLGTLKRLERLDLSETPFTDAGLGHLAALTSLKSLNLRDTRVSDAGIAKLKLLTRLEELHLDGTRLTDAGLAHLEGLTRLRVLSVEDTAVTYRAVAKLNLACPQHPIRNHMGHAMKGSRDPFGVVPQSGSPPDE